MVSDKQNTNFSRGIKLPKNQKKPAGVKVPVKSL